MNPTRSIEIIGGGLAGLSLASALARAGVSVTLHEAGAYPRHRVCGEFITGLPASTRAALQLDPMLADAVANHSVGWFAQGRLVRTQRLPAAALGLSRYVLDARLAEAFVAAGGKLCPNMRSLVRVDAPGRVFATGRRRARPGWLGLKVHATDFPLARDLEVHLGEDAYVGVSRIAPHRVNLCGLFRRRDLAAPAVELLSAYLEACGLHDLRRRLAASCPDPASFCAVAAMEFDRRVPPCLPVRLGDASSVIAPFTGHGMAMAFQSAELALDPLLAYARGDAEWPETRATIQRGLRRRFRVRLASAHALHPFLLRTSRQRWLALLSRSHLLPLRPLYAVLH